MRTKSIKNLLDRHFNESNNAIYVDCSNFRWSIAEEYINSWIDIHLHIRAGTEEYCAFFNWSSRELSLDGQVKVSNNRHLFDNTSNEKQVPVLVRVTQNLEIPEIPPMVVNLPTIARLKRINDGNYCVGHPSEFLPLFSFIFGDIIEDGKLVTFIGDIPFGQDKLPNEMVKRTTEIVEHLSNKDIKTIRHWRYVTEAENLLSCLTIDIIDDDIVIHIADGRQFAIQSLEVLYAPSILSKWTIDGGCTHEQFTSETKYSQGVRDSRSHKRIVRAQLEEGCKS
jgi:hypothetical protein